MRIFSRVLKKYTEQSRAIKSQHLAHVNQDSHINRGDFPNLGSRKQTLS